MALGFAAWGLISAFAPTFRTQFGLSAQATAFLVAVPVLLGSLARLPMGLLTDRFGGRVMFTALFAFTAVAAAIVPAPPVTNSCSPMASCSGCRVRASRLVSASRRAGSHPNSKGWRSASTASAIWGTPLRCFSVRSSRRGRAR